MFTFVVNNDMAALEPRVLATGHGRVRVEETAQTLHALAG
jgi:hypothetical protein